MKLPNGYGSVYKLPGNRRRPWVARKTTGWDGNGKQLYYTIGYFTKRQEALDALSKYNQNPVGERGDITLGAIYDEWSASKYKKIGAKTVESYTVAWKHLSALADVPIKTLRKSHLQEQVDKMDDKGLSLSSCQKVKVLAGLLFKHALADDLVTRNYAELIELPDDTAKEKEPFTDTEIKKIEKAAATDLWANTILILLYTGMRIGEMLTLTKFNVNLNDMIITGGIKTDAGKHRIIPVHPKIQKYIRYWYEQPGPHLIQRKGKRILINYYRNSLYYPTLERLEIRKLSPHSTRHTFASLLNRAGANTKSIQDVLGHADYSTTANIYTHTDIAELRKAVESI